MLIQKYILLHFSVIYIVFIIIIIKINKNNHGLKLLKTKKGK